VQTILDCHKKYNMLVMTAFSNDSGFVESLDKVTPSVATISVNHELSVLSQDSIISVLYFHAVGICLYMERCHV